MNDMHAILDLARWAPSGDNTQPWRFEVRSPRNVVVRGFDTRDHCVYDLDGRPSQLSIGALLETMSIAASRHGWRMDMRRDTSAPDTNPTLDVRFVDDPGIKPDPLADCITQRSVNRRPLATRPLTTQQREALAASVGSRYRLRWFEGAAGRAKVTSLLFSYAKLRLTMPEAYEVHRDIIQWNARHSADKVPDQALGVDPLTLKVMRYVLGSWRRASFFNRFLAGTWAPRIQMDLLPGMACAGHCVIEAAQPPSTIDDYLDAGRAVQRFWLTVTHLGLQMQPSLTPVIFTRYIRDDVQFSSAPGMQQLARKLARRFDALVGEDASPRCVFMARVGAGASAQARSLRRPLAELMVDAAATPPASAPASASVKV